ncbi:lipase secretion chaperone [Undibacterium sp. SXout7W]|uniref:lipase secretion chaperone n=1 Tax=Undibacterium sp. SXout7W TaxID=3413049 RepID=UPI003BF2B18E
MMRNKLVISLTAMSIVAVFFLILYPSLNEENNGHSAIQLRKNDNAFSFIKSLEGTTIDGETMQTQDGELVVSAELRRMFDYYLAAVGERTLNDIQKEIETAIDHQLPARAAMQAKQLLGRYFAYKHALASVETKTQISPSTDMTSAMRQRWGIMQQLREQYFSKIEIVAMFGMDDAYDQDALARTEINTDKTLTAIQKTEKIRQLDAAMPASLRAEKNAPYQIVRLEEQAQAMRQQGASEDDIYRMRAAATSPEAAARLAEVDREDAEWKSRINAYLEQKNQLNAMTAKNESDRQVAMQQVKDQLFNRDEQKRLPAYE